MGEMPWRSQAFSTPLFDKVNTRMRSENGGWETDRLSLELNLKFHQ